MKYIELTQGKRAIVDDEDYEWLNQWIWFYSDSHNHKGYAYSSGLTPGIKRNCSMHRFILNAPKGKEVDHINHDGLDNRRSNLRLVSRGENRRNSVKMKGGSVFKGVYWQKGGWRARIGTNGKLNLGRFKDEIHAAMIYDMAAKDLYGEHAHLNFPNVIHG